MTGTTPAHPKILRLAETPENVTDHPPTTKGLGQLSFMCATCDTLIVPQFAVERVTVRPTPVGPASVQTTANTERVPQDSVFAGFLHEDGIVLGATSVQSPILQSKGLKFNNPHQRTVLCAGCGTDVGYAVEDGTCRIQRIEGRPPFKMVYFKEGRGQVLRLVDEAAWMGMLPGIPCAPPPSKHVHLENTLQLTEKLQVGRGVDVAITDINAMLAEDDRSLLQRVCRQDETPGIHGLTAKDPASEASVVVHIVHGSSSKRVDTRFISMTDEPAVALLWGLPYSVMALVSPALAEMCGTKVWYTQDLRREIDNGSDAAADVKAKALTYVERAHETLIEGGVHAAAVEQLHSRIVGVSGPRFVQRTAAAVAATFPSDPHDFRKLVAIDSPRFRPGPDTGATVLANVNPATGLAAGDEPVFVLMRMSRNSLPGLSLTLQDAIIAGQEQLLKAMRAYDRQAGTGTVLPGAPSQAVVAYYELNISLGQERVVSTLYPAHAKGVPVLLVKWDANAAGAVEALYRLKKGGAA